jgi:PPK2 family polyphosphate:nucleotide phosphotransferase
MLKQFHSKDFLITAHSKKRPTALPTKIKSLYEDDAEFEHLLKKMQTAMAESQALLHAEGRQSLLIIFQGMDTAGKDSAINHVMSGLNTITVHVSAFIKPSAEDLSHDFLWRCQQKLPPRGHIGIFNRSYYEDVTTVRVHPEYLESSHLPRSVLPKSPQKAKAFWDARLSDIRAYESYLSRQGVHVLKFFLHVSKDEQRERLIARIDDPAKNWKFDEADVAERARWSEYRVAFDQCLKKTSTPEAPWYVIPADDKPNARLMISKIAAHHLKEMHASYPKVSPQQRRRLLKLRREL